MKSGTVRKKNTFTIANIFLYFKMFFVTSQSHRSGADIFLFFFGRIVLSENVATVLLIFFQMG